MATGAGTREHAMARREAVRVLAVDDTGAAGNLLRQAVLREPAIVPAGAAADFNTALDRIEAAHPDVLVVNVDRAGGLGFLHRLMRRRPVPVVAAGSLAGGGAHALLEALALGAVEHVLMPSADVSGPSQGFARELAAKLRAAATATPWLGPCGVCGPPSSGVFDDRIIAIGASGGGVAAVQALLSHFPANCPPTLIVHPMPAGLTAAFAARLDGLCAPWVNEAADGAPLTQGQVWLAPGGMHLEVSGRSAPRCRLVAGDADGGPSVDRLFHSLARSHPRRTVGVILTGMGRDGADGLGALALAGGQTVGQDRATSALYGMPRAAWETGAVIHRLPLERIGPFVLDLCRHANLPAGGPAAAETGAAAP